MLLAAGCRLCRQIADEPRDVVRRCRDGQSSAMGRTNFFEITHFFWKNRDARWVIHISDLLALVTQATSVAAVRLASTLPVPAVHANMSMAASTESLGEEIKVLERTLTLGNKLHKLKQDESSLSKKVKGLESKLKSARNIDLATCQKKLASLQEVSDTFGDDDDDAEVLEVTKLLIPKCVTIVHFSRWLHSLTFCCAFLQIDTSNTFR